MLPVWTEKSNTSLGTFEEFETISIDLPLESTTGITTSVITGSLPAGLRLENNKIVGTPVEVARNTTTTFVIRAASDEAVLDRTFKITVQGPDNPSWITPSG